jgi:hypothetical protein
VPAIKKVSLLEPSSLAAAYLANETINFARKSPTNAKFVIDQIGDSTPTFYKYVDGSNKAVLLKKEVEKYLDYEK